MSGLIYTSIDQVQILTSKYKPTFLSSLPAYLQVLAYFGITFILIRLALGTVRALFSLLYVVITTLLRFLGRAADDIELIDSPPFQRWFVATETICHRVGLLWFIHVGFRDGKTEFAAEDRVSREKERVKKRTKLPPLESTAFRVSGASTTTLQIAVLAVVAFGSFFTLIPAAIISLFFERKITILIALGITLWYVDLAQPIINLTNKLLSQISWSSLQVPTLLAIGTLVALIYAALVNSDVRGRAEVNKNASVACRTALLKSVRSLKDIAEQLTNIRTLGLVRLRAFPTEADLAQFSGRPDLVWSGTRLLPEGAGMPYWLRDLDDLGISSTAGILEGFDDGVIKKPPQASAVEAHAPILEAFAIASESTKTVHSHLDELRETGYYIKLDRVLTKLGAQYLIDLEENDFGMSRMVQLLPGYPSPWWESDFAPPEARELKLIFEELHLKDLDGESQVMRVACRNLQKILQRTRINMHKVYWQLGIDKEEILWLARNVDSSLRPKLAERIRQAFGK